MVKYIAQTVAAAVTAFGIMWILLNSLFGISETWMDWQPVSVEGQIQEDDPRWDCRTMGSRDCGPGNAQGLTAGCYNDTAQLVAPWPCHVVRNADGSSDVFAGRP